MSTVWPVGLTACYFVFAGSIPWGVIISRVFYHTDLREHGSGNIGTTNAIRTMGKVGGYAVFVLDFGKGIVAGLIAAVFGTQVLPGNVLAVVEFVQTFGGSPNPVPLHRTGMSCGSVPWLHHGSYFLSMAGFQGRQGIAVAVGCLFPRLALLEPCLKLRFSLFWLWQQSMFPWDPSQRLRHVPFSRCIFSGATPLPCAVLASWPDRYMGS